MTHVVERSFRVMGSDAHVVVVDGPPHAAGRAEERLQLLERRWSRFIDESEISTLNRARGAWCPVSDDTEMLLHAAQTAHRNTGGSFDPSVMDALVAAGYLTDFSFVAAAAGSSPLVRVDVPGIAGVEVADGRARFPAGLQFDPGGIGKGLAADVVVAELLADGTGGLSVNVGGDVVVGGAAPLGDGWHTLARDVTAEGRIISLEGGAVATSSIERRRWDTDRHHIIDPTDGCPAAGGLAAVTVVAGAGWWAEALCTAFTVEGPPAARHLTEGDAAWGRTRAGDLVEFGDLPMLPAA